MDTKWKNNKHLALWLIAAVFIAFGAIAFIKAQDRLLFINNSEQLQNKNTIIDENEYIIAEKHLKYYLNNFDDKTISVDDVSQAQLNAFKKQYLKNIDVSSEIEDKINEYNKKKLVGQEKNDAQNKLIEDITKSTELVSDQALKQELVKEEISFVNKNKNAWLEELNNYNSNISKKNYDYYIRYSDGKIQTTIDSLKKEKYKDALQWLSTKKGYTTIANKTYKVSMNSEWAPYYITEKTGINETVDEAADTMNSVVSHAWAEQSKSTVQVILALKDNSPKITEIKQQKDKYLFYQASKYIGFALLLAGITLLIYQIISTNETFAFWQNRSIEFRMLVIFICACITVLILKPNYNFSKSTDIINGIVLTMIIFIINTLIKNCYEIIKKNPDMPTFQEEWQEKSWIKKILEHIYCLSIFVRLFIYLLMIIFVSIIIVAGLVIISEIFYQFQIVQMFALIIGFVYFIGLIAAIVISINKINHALKKPSEILNANGFDVSPKMDTNSVMGYMDQLASLVNTSKEDSQKSEAFKNDLITNVSHDLRTPLTSIITYGDLLTKDDLTEDNRKEYLDIINQKSARMKEMIEDLFEVIKMDHGDIKANFETVVFNEFLEQIIAENSELFEKNQLTVVSKIPNDASILEIDGTQMWRAIENLIVNASKYSLEGSRVHIKMEDFSEKLIITIKNTSKFLLDEDAEKLIERFGRGDKSRNSEGNGLGLAIVDSIIKMHHGDFDITIDGDMFKVTIELPKNTE